MSKAQTDIRSTSYDIHAANSRGYVGTIEDALWQIACEEDHLPLQSTRELLLTYLGVDKIAGGGPSLELDENPRYGFDEEYVDLTESDPPFFSLAYAEKHGFFSGHPQDTYL